MVNVFWRSALAFHLYLSYCLLCPGKNTNHSLSWTAIDYHSHFLPDNKAKQSKEEIKSGNYNGRASSGRASQKQGNENKGTSNCKIYCQSGNFTWDQVLQIRGLTGSNHYIRYLTICSGHIKCSDHTLLVRSTKKCFWGWYYNRISWIKSIAYQHTR